MTVGVAAVVVLDEGDDVAAACAGFEVAALLSTSEGGGFTPELGANEDDVDDEEGGFLPAPLAIIMVTGPPDL